MDAFDKVEELLLSEGYTKEEIPALMVSLIEQGFNPTAVFAGGLANMLGFLPKKKPQVTTPRQKVTTGTPRQGSLLTKKGTAQNFTGGRTPFTGTDPVPAASSKLPQPSTKPAVSPGQMQIPGTSARAQDLRNVTRNPNVGMPGNTKGFAISSPSKPASSAPPTSNTVSRAIQNLGNRAYATAAAKPPTMGRGAAALRGLKGPAAVAAEIGAEMALKPVAKAGGKALTRTILDITGKGNRARQIAPSLYGKKGPDLTPEIKTGVQQRSKLAQQRAETQAASQPKPQQTGERSAAANAKRQEIAKANAQRRTAAAVNFDKAFASARKAGESEFTWRGKRYNTKLKGE